LGSLDRIDLQVSNNGGGSYTNLATFSGSANAGAGSKTIDLGAYIAANTRIRFIVVAKDDKYLYLGNIQISYDVPLTGGSTAFSTATATASLVVDPVADTPSVTEAATDEDVQTSSGLVISRNVNDGAEVTHFKITAITNGTLYQNDGATPITSGTFITFAEGNAGLKFTPSTNFFGSGSFTIQASLSNSDGGLGGGTVDATITVNAVNDAPVLAGANNFTAITADETTNGGDLISTLIAGHVFDVDAAPFEGIAIQGLNSSTGTWQYSTNSGGTWSGVGTVSTNSALLLRSDDMLRLVPGGPAGNTAAITFRAWDQASGSAGEKVDVTTNGGTTAFSTATGNSSITVNPAQVAQLAFVTQPDLAGAGTPFGQQPVLQTQDSFGNESTVGLAANLIVTATLTSGTGPLQGTATFDIGTASGNGTVSFSDLRLDLAGIKQLTFSAAGLTDAESATFTVDNELPVAGLASFQRPRNVPIKLLIANLLTNATDLNGDALSLLSVSATSTNGAAIYTNATYVLYSLPPDGNVTDRFTYTVSDGTASASGDVEITMAPDATGTNFNVVAYALVAGKPTMTFAGVPGHTYTVQRTQDLSGTPVWTDLWTTNAPAAGLFQYVDETPPVGNLYYRGSNQ